MLWFRTAAFLRELSRRSRQLGVSLTQLLRYILYTRRVFPEHSARYLYFEFLVLKLRLRAVTTNRLSVGRWLYSFGREESENKIQTKAPGCLGIGRVLSGSDARRFLGSIR